MARVMRWALSLSFLVAVACGCSSSDEAAPPSATLPDASIPEAASSDAPVTVSNERCQECHEAPSGAMPQGKHATLGGCVACHKDALAHQADPNQVRATVDFTMDSCGSGSCHASYVAAYLKDDGQKAGKYGGSVKTSKYVDFPAYKHLMGGHGFTLEYNEERAHAYLLKDHIDIGRKQNQVCLQCKSTPITYYWNEKRRGASVFGMELSWKDSVDKVKALWPSTVDHGTACSHCHDPHSTKFRVIRKAMIASILERGTDPYEPAINFIPKTVDELNAKLNERGADGDLTPNARRLVGSLTCSQCHVEYTCGPGVDKTVLRDDFPWRKLRDIEEYYGKKYDTMQDWVHTGTGLRGIKAQHPETEFFWESVHYKAGASCANCHLARSTTVTAPAPYPGGKRERSHWFTSPLKQPAETCGNCHSDLSTRLGRVTRIQDEVMTQAKTVELSLDAVLTKIEANPQVDPTKLAAAKAAFMHGLLWWEFTIVSENSTGAHNPGEAKTNLDTATTDLGKAKTLLGL